MDDNKEAPVRRKRFGRPGKIRPLFELDLRTATGRRWMLHFRRAMAELGEDRVEECREIATLKLMFERAARETLSSDHYVAIRARDCVTPLGRYINKMVGDLRARKPVEPAPPSLAAQIAAQIRAAEGEAGE